VNPDGVPAVDRTAGPEPASVTASRQLAADSRDRRRRVPRGPAEGFAHRSRGTAAGRPAIRPLGRPGADHPDGTATADDPTSDGWRLWRDRPGEVGPCPRRGGDAAPPGA
jgi:hypothetical protein